MFSASSSGPTPSGSISGVPQSLSKHQSISSISSASDSIYQRIVNYTPDFTLKATCDLLFLKIRRSHYIAAYRATCMERQPKTPHILDSLEDPFAKEWKRAISVNDPPDPAELTEGQITVEVESCAESKESATLTSPSMDGDLIPNTCFAVPDCSISSDDKTTDNLLSNSSCDDVTSDIEEQNKHATSQL